MRTTAIIDPNPHQLGQCSHFEVFLQLGSCIHIPLHSCMSVSSTLLSKGYQHLQILNSFLAKSICFPQTENSLAMQMLSSGTFLGQCFLKSVQGDHGKHSSVGPRNYTGQ